MLNHRKREVRQEDIMQKNLKKRSHKAGMPPGTLIHVGDVKEKAIHVSVMLYGEEGYSEWEGPATPDKELPAQGDKIRWVHLDGVHHPEVVRMIGELHGIHALTMEDILNTEHRPKLDETDEGLFLIVKMPTADSAGTITFTSVSILLGDFGVISFSDADEDPFAGVRERIRGGAGRIRKRGSDYLVYGLLDIVVDTYFIVIDQMQEEILLLEEELYLARSQSLLRLQNLQRNVLMLRHVAMPMRDTVAALCRIDDPLIREPTKKYFADALDHIIAVSASTDQFGELLTSMLELHLSMVNTKMNQVVKMLTVFAAIFMPLTFIAGLYGMNFTYMPELSFRYGYFIVLFVMLALAVSMVLFFWRRQWL